LGSLTTTVASSCNSWTSIKASVTNCIERRLKAIHSYRQISKKKQTLPFRVEEKKTTMSFDLTAAIVSTNTNTVIWNFTKDTVPFVLQGRVSISEWASTYDAFTKLYGTYVSSLYVYRKQIRRCMFIPPLLLCLVPGGLSKRNAEKRKYEEGLVQLLKSEQEKYARYGIKVSLAKEKDLNIQEAGRASNQHSTEPAPVGLHFDVGPLPGGYAPAALGKNQFHI
jgi:hypothetical protein